MGGKAKFFIAFQTLKHGSGKVNANPEVMTMFDPSPIYPNDYQPRRPVYDENENRLAFRTYISRPNAKYDLFDLRNIICQTKLYRWVKEGFVNGVPIFELHRLLFWDQPDISKRHLGSTILQAVAYNPRKLIGKRKDNPKACMTYVFFDPKDLEYGLEWMICIWIRRVTLTESVEELEEALTELVDVKADELKGLFWRPIMDPVVREAFVNFDWERLWEQYDLKLQDIPQNMNFQQEGMPPQQSLRSLV